MRWLLPLVCAVLLAPLALVDVPPLLDYPNHLARAVVLAFGARDPLLSQMYAAHWSIIPDLGIDLVLPPLLHLFPVHVAGRIVIGAAVLLPVFGTLAYSRAVFGTRSAWPLASSLVAYNGTLLLGFLNFAAGLGLALLLAAAWIFGRERWPVRSVAGTAAGMIALFFCHLTSVAFCALLIGGHEAEWLWRHRRDHRAMLLRIAATLPLIMGPLGLYLLSPLSPLAAGIAWPSLYDKSRELVIPFANYLLPLDLATAGIVVILVLAGRCRATIGSGIPLVLLALLFVCAPNQVKGTYLFDTRFIIMFALLLFGAVLPRAATVPATIVLAALLLVRMAVLGFAWHEHRQDLAQLRATIASVQPGERVFLAVVSPDEAPTYWRRGPLSRRLSLGLPLDDHLAALLLIEHRAFWPFLFDNPSQQPVMMLPPYRQLAGQVDAIADSHTLAEPGRIDLRGYDDVLLLYAGGIADPAHFAADRLELVAGSDMAALFRIRPGALSPRPR
jgi:hypothetical protein